MISPNDSIHKAWLGMSECTSGFLWRLIVDFTRMFVFPPRSPNCLSDISRTAIVGGHPLLPNLQNIRYRDFRYFACGLLSNDLDPSESFPLSTSSLIRNSITIPPVAGHKLPKTHCLQLENAIWGLLILIRIIERYLISRHFFIFSPTRSRRNKEKNNIVSEPWPFGIGSHSNGEIFWIKWKNRSFNFKRHSQVHCSFTRLSIFLT